jgi:branched-chain amino acid transport system substrate-binding protein
MTASSLLAVAAMALAACTSSKTGAGNDNSSIPAPVISTADGGSSAPGGSSSTAPAGSDPFLTTGKAASGDPVKVGLLNPVSGLLPFPSVLPSAKAAIAYLDSNLGGINGHPISLDVCNSDGTPETAVNCANKFVTDKVSFVLDGFDITAGATLPALDSAKIPTIGNIAFNATSNLSKTSFYYGPASQAYALGPLYVLFKQGVKSAVFVSPDDATDHAYNSANLTPVAKKLGMNLTIDYYPATTAANWTSIAAAVVAKNPGLAAIAGASEGTCTSLLKALRSANFKGQILLGGCTEFIKDAGNSAAAGVLSYTGTWIPSMEANAPDDVKAELTVYQKAMNDGGAGQYINTQQGSGILSAIWTTAAILTAANVSFPLTGDAVSTAMRAAKNAPVMLGPSATCDGNQYPNTSSCINSIMLTKVDSDGTIAPLSNPAFSPLDPSLLPATAGK